MKNHNGVASRDSETNKTIEKIESAESEMATKRIYNPVTGKYYEIRERTSKTGTKGQIKGSWSNKKK